MMQAYFQDIRTAIETLPLPWQNLSEKNILVLGATGLIGGCLVDMLMSVPHINFHVYASGRDTERGKIRFQRFYHSPYFHFFSYDVTQPLNTDIPFHYVIDAAGGASPQLYTTDPVTVMKANIMGVDHLLSYGIQHELERFLYVSSGEVYGEGNGCVFTEDYSGYVNTTAVRSCYPSAKRAAETLCICYGSQYHIPVSIARPCHVYGPGFTESDQRVYAQFIRNVMRGENITLKSKGEQFRSWIYVVDCAMGLLHILFYGAEDAAYNVANQESNVCIKTLAEKVALLANRKVIYNIPDDGTKGITTPITKAIFSTFKLEQLGWRPLFSLDEGLQHTLDSLN